MAIEHISPTSIQRKGVCYDVGRVMFGNWRPDYNPKVVRRELDIIKNDLHCNAVRICGRDIERLKLAAEYSLQLGLEVLLSPEKWNSSPGRTLDYLDSAAKMAETLRQKHGDRIIFSVGSESTLFMKGILDAKTFLGRIASKSTWENIKAGKHNEPLNLFLTKAVRITRDSFQGPITYASLPWEKVHWGLFDFVGIDHYRATCIKDRFGEMLDPLFSHGKPVIVTEFGCCAYQGAEDAGARAFDIIKRTSLLLHDIPVLGKFVRPRLKSTYIRDEGLQAREIIDQINIFEKKGVNGTFMHTFVFPTLPHEEDPRYDLDMASYSLVKTYAKGKKGGKYPDMTWEPKQSFYAVADYYGK